MKFGILVICRFDDGCEEPEGIVMFDSLHPPIGSKVILCDGEEWTVVKDLVEDECNPRVICEFLS